MLHMSQNVWKRVIPVSDTIKRNNVLTFSNRPDPKIKGVKESGVQRHNMTLITQFLSLQSRPNADMMDFFQYENQTEPPSLADRGSLRSGTKSDILQCLDVPTGHEACCKGSYSCGTGYGGSDPYGMAHNIKDIQRQQIIPYLEAQIKNDTQRK